SEAEPEDRQDRNDDQQARHDRAPGLRQRTHDPIPQRKRPAFEEGIRVHLCIPPAQAVGGSARRVALPTRMIGLLITPARARPTPAMIAELPLWTMPTPRRSMRAWPGGPA